MLLMSICLTSLRKIKLYLVQTAAIISGDSVLKKLKKYKCCTNITLIYNLLHCSDLHFSYKFGIMLNGFLNMISNSILKLF